MVNLLQETIADIEASKSSISDIIFIGSADQEWSCTWEEFTKLADVEYDAGYGAPEVATDLVIGFRDGSKLQRAEYDGSEWWEYIMPFKLDYTQAGRTKTITKLVTSAVGWDSVGKINT